jgi:hypothetical protein
MIQAGFYRGFSESGMERELVQLTITLDNFATGQPETNLKYLEHA